MKRASRILAAALAGALLAGVLVFPGCAPLEAGSAVADALFPAEGASKAARAYDEAFEACDRALDSCATAAASFVFGV